MSAVTVNATSLFDQFAAAVADSEGDTYDDPTSTAIAVEVTRAADHGWLTDPDTLLLTVEFGDETRTQYLVTVQEVQ